MVRRETIGLRPSARVADSVSGIQKAARSATLESAARAEGRCVADVRDASRLRRPWRALLVTRSRRQRINREVHRPLGWCACERRAMCRPSSERGSHCEPSMANVAINALGCDHSNRSGLGGFVAVGPQGSGLKRSTWHKACGGVATLRHNNDALTLRASAILVKLKRGSVLV
jgi:hypothetical protein